MSDKETQIDESLIKKVKRRRIIAGATIWGALVTYLWLPRTDTTQYESQASIGAFNSAKEMMNFAHPSAKKNLQQEIERLEIEIALKENVYKECEDRFYEYQDSGKVMEDFRKEMGYSKKDCKACEWLKSEDAGLLDEVASDFGVKEFAYALPEQESDFNPNAASPQGDVGWLQVNRGLMGGEKGAGGADEVYLMFNDPKPRHRKYIEKFKESFSKYKELMNVSKEEFIEKLPEKEFNAVAGFVYMGYKKFKNNKRHKHAYNAGGKNNNRYAKELGELQKKWNKYTADICPELNTNLARFEKKMYKVFARNNTGN